MQTDTNTMSAGGRPKPYITWRRVVGPTRPRFALALIYVTILAYVLGGAALIAGWDLVGAIGFMVGGLGSLLFVHETFRSGLVRVTAQKPMMGTLTVVIIASAGSLVVVLSGNIVVSVLVGVVVFLSGRAISSPKADAILARFRHQ